MNGLWKYVIMSSAVVLAAIVLAGAYTQRYRTNSGSITVTGLGETEFTSDIIVIEAEFSVEEYEAANGYHKMEDNRKKIENFLLARGVKKEEISFNMLSSHEMYENIYSDGDYIGERFKGYRLRQSFTIESNDIDGVERAARELQSLIGEGINIDVNEPNYFYSQLESVKLDLIAAAAADARQRAELIASNSGAGLGQLIWSRAGVFQITAATGDEEFSAGGLFNVSSREKKARVTVRSEFKVVPAIANKQ